MALLAYWPLQNDKRNYGSINYGQEGVPYHFSGNLFFSFSGSKGELFNQGGVSVGLMGLKDGSIPYLKAGNSIYSPDHKYKGDGTWGLEFKKEDFADKSYTLSFYHENKIIYSNGVDFIPFSGHISFLLPQNFKDLKVYDENPLESKMGPYKGPMFGAGSGSVVSGFPLFIGGGNYASTGSGLNLCINAYENTCFLLDELGNILYDESGFALMAEGCIPTVGFFGGLNCYISGSNGISGSFPLYLHQTDLTYRINSGFPLYMDGRNLIGSGWNLTVRNNYSGVSGGVELYIGNTDGLNDGFIPIVSGFPLYLHRKENLLQGINCYISGGTVGFSGGINLVLQASKTSFATGINLSLPYVHSIVNSGLKLYLAGW